MEVLSNGKLSGLHANIRLGWRWMTVTNTLAYLRHGINNGRKSFIVQVVVVVVCTKINKYSIENIKQMLSYYSPIVAWYRCLRIEGFKFVQKSSNSLSGILNKCFCITHLLLLGSTMLR
jgi:hypothetical protein